MKKTAIILGASGLTGNLLLQLLVAHPDYDSIKLFSRKPHGANHPKVTEFIGNLLQLDQFDKDFFGDEVYCCIGTTAKQTPNKKLYHQIDYGIPVAAAKLCKKNKINTMVVVSAMGANPNSRIFYNRTKGEMEQAIIKLNLSHTFLLRPSFIGGTRSESRTGERIGITVAKYLKPLMQGGLRKYRIIDASTIANAMVNITQTKPHEQVLLSDQIEILGKSQILKKHYE